MSYNEIWYDVLHYNSTYEYLENSYLTVQYKLFMFEQQINRRY